MKPTPELKVEPRSNVIPLDTSHGRLLSMLSTALGDPINKLLAEDDVVEIMVNPDGHLWIDRLSKGRSDTGVIIRPEDAQRVIELVSSSTGSVCNAASPMVSAELPGCGSRFQGILPPVTSVPVFTIRKKALMVFTLDDYVAEQIMTAPQKNKIIDAVHSKKNILIIGGTGSGKTTLANAILNEIAKTNDRCIIIEDTQELQCSALDVVFMRSREHVSMNDLLRATMRLRPDRIIVGEVRGPEALSLLKALNTGHPGGIATLHANSAKGGLLRMEQLIQEAVPTPQQVLIAEAINLIVYIERFENSRRIKDIVEVKGFKNGDYILEAVKEKNNS